MPSRIVIEKPRPSVSITRFDAQQRAQHILLISSFFILAITAKHMLYFVAQDEPKVIDGVSLRGHADNG